MYWYNLLKKFRLLDYLTKKKVMHANIAILLYMYFQKS